MTAPDRPHPLAEPRFIAHLAASFLISMSIPALLLVCITKAVIR